MKEKRFNPAGRDAVKIQQLMEDAVRATTAFEGVQRRAAALGGRLDRMRSRIDRAEQRIGRYLRREEEKCRSEIGRIVVACSGITHRYGVNVDFRMALTLYVDTCVSVFNRNAGSNRDIPRQRPGAADGCYGSSSGRWFIDLNTGSR